MRAAAAPLKLAGQGEIHGVEQWLLLKSHWSRSLSSSWGVGPPYVCRGSPLETSSNAAVRSQIWTPPLLCPVKMKRRGLDPIRLEPSHSWTQNDVIVTPSAARMTQTLKYKVKWFKWILFHRYTIWTLFLNRKLLSSSNKVCKIGTAENLRKTQERKAGKSKATWGVTGKWQPVHD